MTEAALFFSTFALVFLLGIQQLNVQGNHYFLAVVTSFFIGGTQIFLWRTLPTAAASEIAATLCGGPLGIILAMWVHPNFVKFFKRDK